MRGVTPDWSNEEFESLAKTILEEVSNGHTVVDACEKWCNENPVRSTSSARYKWIVRLSKQYAKEYEWAKEQGAKVNAERKSQQRESVRAVQINRVVPLIPQNGDDVPTMTKRELIKFLRNVNIVGDDEGELRTQTQRMQQELNDTIRERDEYKHKLLLMEKKYEEMSAEYNQLVSAFNIVRRNVAGVGDVSKSRVVIGHGGVVERVESD